METRTIMKMTNHQAKVARDLESGLLIPSNFGGNKYNGRALRPETEVALKRHFGNELVIIRTKGTRVNSSWLTLRSHVAEINEVKPVVNVQTFLNHLSESV